MDDTITVMKCPFCKKSIVHTNWQTPIAFVEECVREHVQIYHSLRCKINPKLRRALKHGRTNTI